MGLTSSQWCCRSVALIPLKLVDSGAKFICPEQVYRWRQPHQVANATEMLSKAEQRDLDKAPRSRPEGNRKLKRFDAKGQSPG